MSDDELLECESKPPKIQLKVKEEPNKKYGLILKQKKTAPAFNAFSNVFRPGSSKGHGQSDVKPKSDLGVKTESGLGVAAAAFQADESEESDHEERTVEQVNRNLKKRQQQSLAAQSVQQTIQSALEQDSSVFQYDEVYDSMKQKEHRKVEEMKAADRKSKYAADLMRAAEKRKVMNELRVERSVQKERQAEGTQYADKESFVTESYKRKLEERAEMEREIKRDEMLEARRNKTQEFSGFYRNYLDKVCRDGSEKLEVQVIDESTEINSEEEMRSGSLEQADSLANIKTGGLILPSKKRPTNIRKRPSEDKQSKRDKNLYESSDDEENSAPASKIRELQSRQHEEQRVVKTAGGRKVRKNSDAENSDKSGSESNSDSGADTESESSNAEATEKVSPIQPYKPLPQVVLKDPEEERKENLRQKMEKIVKLFERRNSDEDIEAARQRYFMRKRAGLIKPVICKE